MENEINYTAETLANIARKRINAIDDQLKELEHQRDKLLDEHKDLYAMLMAYEGEGGE